MPIIVITAYGDLRTAVEAVRRGAFDYIAKPFDVDKVKVALVAGAGRAGQENDRQHAGRRRASKAWSAARRRCRKSTSGSRWPRRRMRRCCWRRERHRQGTGGPGHSSLQPPRDGPFVAVNVAALDPAPAESELFGHVRGAFTGADEDRAGLLVQANGGTLFLDEVADIPLPTQVKLLRAWSTTKSCPSAAASRCRPIFASSRRRSSNLLRAERRGTFRHDLFFRLCAFQIDLPPLRDRPEDIAELAELLHRRRLPARRRTSRRSSRRRRSPSWNGGRGTATSASCGTRSNTR